MEAAQSRSQAGSAGSIPVTRPMRRASPMKKSPQPGGSKRPACGVCSRLSATRAAGSFARTWVPVRNHINRLDQVFVGQLLDQVLTILADGGVYLPGVVLVQVAQALGLVSVGGHCSHLQGRGRRETRSRCPPPW